MVSPHSTDRELVEDFLEKQDESSFRSLYRAHTPGLFRMAYRLLDPGPERAVDVEDVVQETWIRATARLARFEWRSELRTWLTSILINCVRESVRRKLRKPLGEAETRCRAESTNVELGVELDRLVATLPARARAVLTLHDIEGFTHEEIGELLEISAGTSKSQLFDARRRLRERLGGHR